MIMIIGGAFQGKNAYIHKKFGFLAEDIIDGESCIFNEIFAAKCVKNFHLLVKRMLAEKIDVIDFTESFCTKNPDAVVVIDEIGCGIIPLEKSERVWREMTGRAGCIIAEKSASVIRINCGIPVIIKGDLQ